MANNEHHLTYDKEKGDWKVKRNNGQRASGRYPTKKEGEDGGREISRNQKTEFVIHNKKDGQIADKDSHGNDPRKIKG